MRWFWEILDAKKLEDEKPLWRELYRCEAQFGWLEDNRWAAEKCPKEALELIGKITVLRYKLGMPCRKK